MNSYSIIPTRIPLPMNISVNQNPNHMLKSCSINARKQTSSTVKPYLNCQMELKISSCFLLVSFSSFLFGLLHPIPVSGQCLNDQKSLLLALKNDLKFDPSLSTKIVGWNESLDCCHWGGVACDKAGQVTRLDISNESISGGIDGSSTLFGLSFLQSLNLADNSFNSAQLPSGFGKLTVLSYLNLSNSNFQGQVPGDFSLMKRLVTLDLSSSPYYTL
ncbi:hypothetical protein OSB04_025085 [Centaurea solstitialis]|uniref:Leucine-rich repeat-containing N-terminal plant-type domain-containing protein n=1 Tax=Centaurea solstitialis TaxID=347529 RepID=A0AA38T6U2_9ASTR|nr:hypothetical protein OSB04_025085 [Centaurea solstitialis]